LDAAHDPALFRQPPVRMLQTAGWLLPDDYALAAALPAGADVSEILATKPDPVP
jgi:hypothetical protein